MVYCDSRADFRVYHSIAESIERDPMGHTLDTLSAGFIHEREGSYLSDEMGFVITHEEWFALRAVIDRFYTTTTPEQIAAYTRERDTKRLARQSRTAPVEKKKNRPGWIYVLKSENGLYKIGRTIDVEKRLSSLRIGHPVDLNLVHSFEVPDMAVAEEFLHSKFKHCRKRGEWFDLSQAAVEWLCRQPSENFGNE